MLVLFARNFISLSFVGLDSVMEMLAHTAEGERIVIFVVINLPDRVEIIEPHDGVTRSILNRLISQVLHFKTKINF